MKLKSGLSRLDKILGGGLPEKSAILLSGGPGAGKTLFGINFLLEGAREGEKCCYISLNETKDEILRACEGIESLSGVKDHIGKNMAIEHIQLGESITMKRFIDIISTYPKIDRLVIDNLNKLLIFSREHWSYRVYLTDLLQQVKHVAGCTLLLCETEGSKLDSGNGEAFEVDGIINLEFLDFEEKPIRILSVHKMRYASFEPKVSHHFVIDSKGLRLDAMKII